MFKQINFDYIIATVAAFLKTRYGIFTAGFVLGMLMV